MSEREAFDLWFECDTSWDRSIKEACWEAWQARASADSDGKRNDAEPVANRFPEGWRLITRKTHYQLAHGNEVVATLAGPDAEHNAAILAALLDQQPAQGREQWVKCSERLPIEADGPYVWFSTSYAGPRVQSWSAAAAFGRKVPPETDPCWMPTGLKRPRPPQPQSSGEDE